MNTIRPRMGLALVFSAALAAPFTSYGQNDQSSAVPAFTEIHVGGGIDLTIHQGPTHTIEADDGVITEIRGGTLTIRREQRFFDIAGWFGSYDAEVTLSDLDELQASAGSDVNVEGRLSGDTLEISVSSGSDVRIDVEMDELTVESSSGSDITVMGTVDRFEASASSGSDIDARRLTAREARIEASSGSDASVTVVERIFARASSGSDISYWGMPSDVDVDSSSGADISARDGS